MTDTDEKDICPWTPEQVFCLGVFMLINLNEQGVQCPDLLVFQLRDLGWITVDEENCRVKVTNLGKREWDAYSKWRGWDDGEEE